MLEGQSYLARSEGGLSRGKFKGGTFRVDSSRQEDGSIIQPTPDARKHIEKVLRKEGRSDDVAAVLQRFDAGAENCLLPLAPGLAAYKWRIDEIAPAFDGRSLSEQVLLKIAYEFAACHLADKAYEESPPLVALRSALLSPESPLDPDAVSIDYLTTRTYAPVHGLALHGQTPHVVVSICLFGWLLFRVHLRRIAIGPPHFKYTCYLDTGTEDCEILQDKTDRKGSASDVDSASRPQT
jgi:hypothetical protein